MLKIIKSLVFSFGISLFAVSCGDAGQSQDSSAKALTTLSSGASREAFQIKMEARYGALITYSDAKLPAGYSWEAAYEDTLKAESLANQYLYKLKSSDSQKDQESIRAALVIKAIMTLNETDPNDLSWYQWRGQGKSIKGFLSEMENNVGDSFKNRGLWRQLMSGFSFRVYDKEIFERNAPWGQGAIKLPHWLDCVVDGAGGGCN